MLEGVLLKLFKYEYSIDDEIHSFCFCGTVLKSVKVTFCIFSSGLINISWMKVKAWWCHDPTSEFQTYFYHLKKAVLFTQTRNQWNTPHQPSPSVVLYYSLDVRPVSEAAAGLVCKQHGVGPTCFCTLLTGPVRLIGAEVRRQAAKSRLFPSLTATNKGHYIKCVSKLWLEG